MLPPLRGKNATGCGPGCSTAPSAWSSPTTRPAGRDERPVRAVLADAWGEGSLQLGLAAPGPGTAARARPARRGALDGHRAADRADLWHKGRIAEAADLCVLAPDESFVVDPAASRHRHPVAVRRTHAHRRRPADLAGRATVDLGASRAQAAARTSGAPMSHDFDQPDLASRALGAGVVHANDDLRRRTS